MNFINVVSNKSYDKGFILQEAEYRRVIQIIEEQIKKVPNSEDLKIKFLIKFENGTVAESEDIDSIFNLENTGTQRIIMLRANVEKTENDKITTGIKLVFGNPNSESNDSYVKAVRYSIIGLTRDWVMVTTSLIEERLQKIMRRNITTKSLNIGVY